jgi:hypothetical protein
LRTIVQIEATIESPAKLLEEIRSIYCILYNEMGCHSREGGNLYNLPLFYIL